MDNSGNAVSDNGKCHNGNADDFHSQREPLLPSHVVEAASAMSAEAEKSSYDCFDDEDHRLKRFSSVHQYGYGGYNRDQKPSEARPENSNKSDNIAGASRQLRTAAADGDASPPGRGATEKRAGRGATRKSMNTLIRQGSSFVVTKSRQTWDGVFLPVSLSVFGVVLFIRLPWIIGQCGFALTLLGIGICYTCSLLTTISLAAISTNGDVGDGGPYMMIARCLGPQMGVTVGLLFVLANLVSSAMYLVGGADVVVHVLDNETMSQWYTRDHYAVTVMVSSAMLLVLLVVASLKVEKAFRSVCLLLTIISIADAMIYISVSQPRADNTIEGSPHFGFTGVSRETWHRNWGPSFSPGYDFAKVLSILFPGVSGIMSGVCLSGDLRKGSKGIPRGIAYAWVLSLTTYVAMTVVIAAAFDRDVLKVHYRVLRGASHPWVFLPGEFCSAFVAVLAMMVGSARVLRAIGRDGLLPFKIFQLIGSASPVQTTIFFWACIQLLLFVGDQYEIASAFATQVFCANFWAINMSTFLSAAVGIASFRPWYKFFNKFTAFCGALVCICLMFYISPLFSAIVVGCTLLLLIFTDAFIDLSKAYWGDATQALFFYAVRKWLLRLDERKEHIRHWRPSIIQVVTDPLCSLNLLHLGNNLKKGGLFEVALLVKGDFDSTAKMCHKWKGWLMDFISVSGIKAFAVVAFGSDMRVGVQYLIRLSGLGGMRPNTIMFNLDEYLLRDTFRQVYTTYKRSASNGRSSGKQRRRRSQDERRRSSKSAAGGGYGTTGSSHSRQAMRASDTVDDTAISSSSASLVPMGADGVFRCSQKGNDGKADDYLCFRSERALPVLSTSNLYTSPSRNNFAATALSPLPPSASLDLHDHEAEDGTPHRPRGMRSSGSHVLLRKSWRRSATTGDFAKLLVDDHQSGAAHQQPAIREDVCGHHHVAVTPRRAVSHQHRTVGFTDEDDVSRRHAAASHHQQQAPDVLPSLSSGDDYVTVTSGEHKRSEEHAEEHTSTGTASAALPATSPTTPTSPSAAVSAWHSYISNGHFVAATNGGPTTPQQAPHHHGASYRKRKTGHVVSWFRSLKSKATSTASTTTSSARLVGGGTDDDDVGDHELKAGCGSSAMFGGNTSAVPSAVLSAEEEAERELLERMVLQRQRCFTHSSATAGDGGSSLQTRKEPEPDLLQFQSPEEIVNCVYDAYRVCLNCVLARNVDRLDKNWIRSAPRQQPRFIDVWLIAKEEDPALFMMAHCLSQTSVWAWHSVIRVIEIASRDDERDMVVESLKDFLKLHRLKNAVPHVVTLEEEYRHRHRQEAQQGQNNNAIGNEHDDYADLDSGIAALEEELDDVETRYALLNSLMLRQCGCGIGSSTPSSSDQEHPEIPPDDVHDENRTALIMLRLPPPPPPPAPAPAASKVNSDSHSHEQSDTTAADDRYDDVQHDDEIGNGAPSSSSDLWFGDILSLTEGLPPTLLLCGGALQSASNDW